MSDRIDWTIWRKGQLWLASHKGGTSLVARTRAELMSKINRYEKEHL